MAAQPTIGGRYELLRRLGAGGMAEVWLARQVGLLGFEKLVVIKRVLPERESDGAAVKLFLDEARTVADLRHPNVVDVYELSQDSGNWFLVMEFLQGPNTSQIWREALAREEPIPLGVCVQIGLDAAAALAYAHDRTDMHGRRQTIVHRDVSPQNLIVTYAGVTKLIDFGIARTAAHGTEAGQGQQVRGK